jgi:hypothetical protein
MSHLCLRESAGDFQHRSESSPKGPAADEAGGEGWGSNHPDSMTSDHRGTPRIFWSGRRFFVACTTRDAPGPSGLGRQGAVGPRGGSLVCGIRGLFRRRRGRSPTPPGWCLPPLQMRPPRVLVWDYTPTCPARTPDPLKSSDADMPPVAGPLNVGDQVPALEDGHRPTRRRFLPADPAADPLPYSGSSYCVH